MEDCRGLPSNIQLPETMILAGFVQLIRPEHLKNPWNLQPTLFTHITSYNIPWKHVDSHVDWVPHGSCVALLVRNHTQLRDQWRLHGNSTRSTARGIWKSLWLAPVLAMDDLGIHGALIIIYLDRDCCLFIYLFILYHIILYYILYYIIY